MTQTTLDYGNVQNLGALDRIINAVLGASLIGFVFTQAAAGYLGWFSILPLLAIYPCLASMTGFSPVRAALYAIAVRIKQYWSYYYSGQRDHMDIFAH